MKPHVFEDFMLGLGALIILAFTVGNIIIAVAAS